MKKILFLLSLLSSTYTFGQSINVSSSAGGTTYQIRRNGLGFGAINGQQINTQITNQANFLTFGSRLTLALDFNSYSFNRIEMQPFGYKNTTFQSRVAFGQGATPILLVEYTGTTALLENTGTGIPLSSYYYNNRVVSIKLVVDCGVDGYFSEEFTRLPNYQVSVSYDQIYGNFYVWNKAGNSGLILNKPFRLLVTLAAP